MSDEGILYQVIGTTLRLNDAKVELRLARRTTIQPIPIIFTQPDALIDAAQPPYALHAPEMVEPIDLTVPALIDQLGGGGTGGSGTSTGGGTGAGTGIIVPGPQMWRLVYVRARFAPVQIVESQKQEVITTFGTIAFTFGAAVAGDFLFVSLCNVTHTSINIPVGWSSDGATFSSGSGTNATYWTVYKVATGGETSVSITLFSGSGMKSAVFVNVRGCDGSFNSHTAVGDHVTGDTVSAPVLGSVPAGALSFSMLVGGDDFLTNGLQFACSVSGSGWTEVQDACSNIPTSDQGGITVAMNRGTGTLSAGVGTFSRSMQGHVGASFYLKS